MDQLIAKLEAIFKQVRASLQFLARRGCTARAHLDNVPRSEVKSVRERIHDIILRRQQGRPHHLLIVSIFNITIAQTSRVLQLIQTNSQNYIRNQTKLGT